MGMADVEEDIAMQDTPEGNAAREWSMRVDEAGQGVQPQPSPIVLPSAGRQEDMPQAAGTPSAAVLVVIGAAVACAGLFLPWLTVHGLINTISVSGFDAAGFAEVRNGLGVKLLDARPWLLLIPACALLVVLSRNQAVRAGGVHWLSLGAALVACGTCGTCVAFYLDVTAYINANTTALTEYQLSAQPKLPQFAVGLWVSGAGCALMVVALLMLIRQR